MNPQDELLVWLKDAAERGEEFLVREAPLYAQEVLSWYKTECYLGIALGIAMAIAAPLLMRASSKYWKIYVSLPSGRDDWPFGVSLLSGLAAAICIILSFTTLLFSITGAIKAEVAPRVVIIEQLTGHNK